MKSGWGGWDCCTGLAFTALGQALLPPPATWPGLPWPGGSTRDRHRVTSAPESAQAPMGGGCLPLGRGSGHLGLGKGKGKAGGLQAVPPWEEGKDRSPDVPHLASASPSASLGIMAQRSVPGLTWNMTGFSSPDLLRGPKPSALLPGALPGSGICNYSSSQGQLCWAAGPQHLNRVWRARGMGWRGAPKRSEHLGTDISV